MSGCLPRGIAPRRFLCAALVGLSLSASFNTQLPAAPPANDNCANATNIGLGQTPFTTAEATSAGPGVCVAFGKDIWFKHRARWTAKLKVSLCDAATFDTVVTVYRGTSCNDATLIANMIGCNDDKTGCSGGTSELVVNVVKDQVYLIRIGGYNAASGTGVLELSCGDPESAACAGIIKTGNAAEDRMGYAISRGGLMNADNKADILIGAYLNDDSAPNAGAVYALQGETLSSLYTLLGDAAADNYGFAVAVGDINADGRDDIIVGAPLNDDAGANVGKVYAYDGFTGDLLWTAVGQAAGDRFGYSVAVVGDVNNDGKGDVIVGAPFNDAKGNNAGRAYILSGVDGARLRIHSGQNAGDRFGFAVSGATDLNNDGRADYAIGEPFNDQAGKDAGRVSVFNGINGKVLIRLTGDAAGDRFGSAIAAARFTAVADYTFFVIGAPFNDFGGNNAGRARVFFRNHTNPNELGCTKILCLRYTINGTSVGGRLGSSVALGDLVGNSAADIIVGAPYLNSPAASAGGVYVFDGNGASLSKRFFGEAKGDRFGTAVAFAGDIDNNGENDVVVGAPFNDAGGSNAGRAYAFLFGQGVLSRTALPSVAYGDAAIEPLPPSHELIGDANHDGMVDVSDLIAIVAAWGPCSVNSPCSGDINRDRLVNVDDLLLVLAAMQSVHADHPSTR